MNENLYSRNDFEASVEIFSKEEGGRNTPAFNGIRWDLVYADQDLNTLSMVWPDFCDAEGNSLDDEEPLPTGKPLHVRFFVCAPEMRAYHRNRIEIGTRFFCHEGPRRVASGIVTRIVDLLID